MHLAVGNQSGIPWHFFCDPPQPKIWAISSIATLPRFDHPRFGLLLVPVTEKLPLTYDMRQNAGNGWVGEAKGKAKHVDGAAKKSEMDEERRRSSAMGHDIYSFYFPYQSNNRFFFFTNAQRLGRMHRFSS